MNIKNYNYSRSEVSAICRSSNYLWLAFEGSGGECTLLKTSAFNPEQIFFTLTVPVDKVRRMKVNGYYIYLAVESDTYSAIRYAVTDPLVTYDYLTIPSGIDEEKTVDVAFISTDSFFLVPGELSGENAKIIKVDSDFTYDSTIDLVKSGEEITDARTMDNDDNDNLWVATYTNPTKLIRVYDSGGYTFDSWEIA